MPSVLPLVSLLVTASADSGRRNRCPAGCSLFTRWKRTTGGRERWGGRDERACRANPKGGLFTIDWSIFSADKG